MNVFKIIFNYYSGAYVPLTQEGNLMVDEVLASCHASVDHNLAHLTMAPVQWFPDLTNWTFGEDSGFQIYVTVLEQLAKWLLPHGQLWM